jgi:hypothetical protein
VYGRSNSQNLTTVLTLDRRLPARHRLYYSQNSSQNLTTVLTLDQRLPARHRLYYYQNPPNRITVNCQGCRVTAFGWFSQRPDRSLLRFSDRNLLPSDQHPPTILRLGALLQNTHSRMPDSPRPLFLLEYQLRALVTVPHDFHLLSRFSLSSSTRYVHTNDNN